MFNSVIIDFAIGLTLSFLAVSLAASAITEAISSALKWREETLLEGIKALLNDQDFKGIALQLYNHARSVGDVVISGSGWCCRMRARTAGNRCRPACG
jgi:hypothetical protein